MEYISNRASSTQELYRIKEQLEEELLELKLEIQAREEAHAEYVEEMAQDVIADYEADGLSEEQIHDELYGWTESEEFLALEKAWYTSRGKQLPSDLR